MLPVVKNKCSYVHEEVTLICIALSVIGVDLPETFPIAWYAYSIINICVMKMVPSEYHQTPCMIDFEILMCLMLIISKTR